MTNAVVLLMALCVGGAAGWLLHTGRLGTGSSPSPPTIEQIQQLASLTVLRVPIADVEVCQMEGYTGGLHAALVVKGDVEISTDLSAARLDTVDVEHRRAVLVLLTPTATRPRVDHDHTRIYKIDRSGLWQVLPGDAGERDLVNQALQDAQRMIGQAGMQRELIDQARSRTKQLVTDFFRALGWQVEVRWLDHEVPAHVASRAGTAS